MMWITSIAIAWVAEGVAAYFLLRAAEKLSDPKGRWSKSDRRFALALSITGPIAMIGGLVIYLIERDYYRNDKDDSASW